MQPHNRLPELQAHMQMKTSIIIPTYNRINSLKRVVAALEKQVYPRADFEVVVISDGSTDGTAEFLNQLTTPLNLVAIQQENGGPASARNHGLQIACGDIIIFLDDDVIPQPTLIQEHMRIFQEQGDHVIGLGPMITPLDHQLSPWVAWEQKMLVKQYDAMQRGDWAPTARQFYTGNSAAARQRLLDAGGFDPTFKRAEDVELAYRLADKGAVFVFNPDAVGYHYAERSFPSWLATPYAYGTNDVLFYQKKGQTWLLPTMRAEFHQRHVLIRALTRACLGRPGLGRFGIALLKQLALLSQRLGQEKWSYASFSGIFNLRYYQGVADQLGGRALFLNMMGDNHEKEV